MWLGLLEKDYLTNNLKKVFFEQELILFQPLMLSYYILGQNKLDSFSMVSIFSLFEYLSVQQTLEACFH